MSESIADIRCPSCGAPAKFDILRQQYLCSYCGGTVGIRDAQAQRQGFRSIQQEKIRQSADCRRLLRASCTGCGAELVFEEGDALTGCAFCGRALVRKDYLSSDEMPELIVPFRITREEAAESLSQWCRKNAGKAEAKHLQAGMPSLNGFYLPYELIRGPVTCKVSRMDAPRNYFCSGYVDNVFVNCSRQLDNLLLDAAEPFELEDLRPFDFSFAAGQRIKIGDIDAKELQRGGGRLRAGGEKNDGDEGRGCGNEHGFHPAYAGAAALLLSLRGRCGGRRQRPDRQGQRPGGEGVPLLFPPLVAEGHYIDAADHGRGLRRFPAFRDGAE